MSFEAVKLPAPVQAVLAAALLLSAVGVGLVWHLLSVRPAEAASETFTIPLTTEPQQAPAERKRADSAPPPPSLAPAGSEPALSEPAAPEPAAPASEPPESQAPESQAPAGAATPQAANRDGDTEAMLRQLMADDSVVAIVDGKAILWGEVWRAIEELPSDYRSQPERLFPALLRRAVDMILLVNAARREDLDKDPAIRREVAAYEERLLRERLLQQRIDAAVTDEALQALYFEHIRRQAAAVEVTASHIQLDSEAAALAVIVELDRGADFATLAYERSQAASGKQGGSLGTFRLDRMPPSFAAVIAQLKPGEYSRKPAQSEFGWHVIKLEQRSGDRLPSFAELAPELRKQAERNAIDDLLQELRQRASIEIMPVTAGAQKSN